MSKATFVIILMVAKTNMLTENFGMKPNGSKARPTFLISPNKAKGQKF